METDAPRVVLVTAIDVPIPDEESRRVVTALRARGIDARLEAWDDPQVAWDWAPLTIIRSTWNYTEQLDAFLQWLRSTEKKTALRNPGAVVLWNHHKQYLVELADADIAVVPTTLVAPEDDHPSLDGDLVIKPAVSVGAIGTKRITDDPTAASAHLAALLEQGTALVQPYCAEIEQGGERSLIFIDGTLAHTICKRPAAGDFRVHEHFGGTNEAVDVAPADLALAKETLAYITSRFGSEPLLYARVDIVDAAEGPALSELELIEPYLYLRDAPDPLAAQALVVAAIERRARSISAAGSGA